MSNREAFRPRATPWLGAALLCLFMASQASAATRVPLPPREVPQVDRCECGPLDVAFVIDDTGSMGGSLNAFKAGFSTLLSQIQTSSNGDYRLGLITFKDNVRVVQNLAAGNDVAMQAAVNALTASGGAGGPEASDQALNTAIHNIVSRPNQIGSFSGYWRTGARRVIVLITDNRPGGFNDSYTGPALANLQAQEAYNAGIRIHSVYVPTSSTPDATVVGIMQNYANVSRGSYRLTLPGGADIRQAVQDFMSDCRTPSDVYIRDTPADLGFEPSAGSIYTSPDIKVCTSANGCATSTNPVFGSNNNYVFVTLRNSGPLRPTGPIGGSLHLYYLPAGGNSTWPGSWQLIKVEHGLFLDASETRDVRIKWDNVPAPGHYCLLARWVSEGDPMSFPELIGSNTVNNTQQNNNVAWRNLNVIRILTGGVGTSTYDVRPLPGTPMKLSIRPEAEEFPGRVAVDLGARIFEVWKAGGGKEEGVEGVEGTTLFFGGRGGALFLHTDETLDERLHLRFFSEGEEGVFPMHIVETDDKGTELGGVRYDLDVISESAEPLAVDLAAERTKDSGVELTWPHAVHHKAYRVIRSDSPEKGTGEAIAEFEAGEARETEALRFADREGADGRFYYSVISISDGGETWSEPVTADAPLNDK